MAHGHPTVERARSSSSASARASCSVEDSKAHGGPAAPEHATWIVVGEQPSGLANLEQLLDFAWGSISMRRRPRMSRNQTRWS